MKKAVKVPVGMKKVYNNMMECFVLEAYEPFFEKFVTVATINDKNKVRCFLCFHSFFN